MLVVSRDRVLREVTAARQLRDAEQTLTGQLQAQVDRTKEALAAEELELARLRATLPEGEFTDRVRRFDRRMRLARRLTQERAASLQRAFQQARQSVVDALPPLLEAIRTERGAEVILNADQVLAADGAVDVTELVIARYNATVTPPPVPEIDTSELLFDLSGADE